MVCDFLKADSIIYELQGSDRDEILAEMTEKIISLNSCLSREEVYSSLCSREEKKSTLISRNLAIPHAVSSKITEPVVTLGLSHKGVEFDMSNTDKENNSACLVFCLIFPENNPDEHLNILKDILLMVKEPDFMNSILQAENCSEIIDIINRCGV